VTNKDISKSKVDVSLLEAEYKNITPLAIRFIDELCHQLNQLLDNELIFLSFPIQHRLKSWQSISAKLEKKSVALDEIKDLTDLIGLRIILQFKRDIEKVCRLINANFNVIEQYDTSERLKEDQFGYSSIHFIIELPEK
jgi:ppGpp synthetase/RelA/SpoT-type nucleotidyltranferase